MNEPYRCRFPDDGCVLVARVEMATEAVAKALGELRGDFKEERNERRETCAVHESRLSSLERWRTGLAYAWGLVVAAFAMWKAARG